MKGSFEKTRKKTGQANAIFLFLEILKIIKQDRKLIWRQRPNLNLKFQGAKVITNSWGLRDREVDIKKDKNTFRIVCLGASPTFGWGVGQDKTYPSCLEKLLGSSNNIKTKVEVINAAEIGYSSHQGLVFLQENILKLSPDLITVSYVINDIDKDRFYRNNGYSDKELMPISKVKLWLENFMARSDIYNWIKHVIVESKRRDIGCLAGGKSWRPSRVSQKDYRNNLKNFIKTATENDIKMLFIAMPVNLPALSYPPEEDIEKETLILNNANNFIKSKDYQKAISLGEEALQYNSYSSRAFYYLGFCFNLVNRPEKAKDCFEKAKKNESMHCGRLGKIYNDIMREVAGKSNIRIIDAASVFNTISADKETYLFLDPQGDTIHPNEKGHEIIAGQLFKVLLRYDMIES